ncbi:hypothetical protein [Nocardia arthritidis]|uniref:Uncharacterized protein n=1 Tax=Nocardia arthritidis TaxID=228602 RepID=A0A6G9YBV3_9NOCA|nr:hypothetical protein [Nocardia arthritidis]QIS10755.1 hypothetical protein F5544_14340 [Nocardia arthritidis]
MTDYYRSIAAYVASQSGHRTHNDHPKDQRPPRPVTPDTSTDTPVKNADSEADRGRTR